VTSVVGLNVIGRTDGTVSVRISGCRVEIGIASSLLQPASINAIQQKKM
jgi:hypothetical protein